MRRGLYSRGSEVSEEGFLGRVTRGGWGAGGGTRPWCHAGGSAKGMPCTQCARSAKFWMSANTRTLVLAPFDKFLVPYKGFLASQAFRTWHI